MSEHDYDFTDYDDAETVTTVAVVRDLQELGLRLGKGRDGDLCRFAAEMITSMELALNDSYATQKQLAVRMLLDPAAPQSSPPPTPPQPDQPANP